jgi:hypothetical protein
MVCNGVVICGVVGSSLILMFILFSCCSRPCQAGSIALAPGLQLQWGVKSVADITEESLLLLCRLDPPLELLVMGCGYGRIFAPFLTFPFNQHRNMS